MYYSVKILVSVIIILLVSEVSKRSVFLGAIAVSLPLVSLISICWLYYETHDVGKVSSLSWEIFWLVIPSLMFFAVFPWLLEHGRGFVFAMIVGILGTIIAYGGMIIIRRNLQ